MKEFNKILYDILLKLQLDETNQYKLKINHKLIYKYFNSLKDPKNLRYLEFESYFTNFFDFCFKLPLDNMVKEVINFKN